MDYEKKYKDALGWMQSVYPTMTGADKEDAEHFFPELKESEDERIRKWLIAQLELKSDVNNSHDLELMILKSIDWLEKQGEQKLDGTFVNVDDVRDDFMQEVYRVLDADSTNDRANQIIDAFDNLPTVAIEKQGEVDKESYEIAEKEKYDFVSGQFLECRKSFDEFKEYNSYWFEYVGNDTYIGRSDNILNKKFYITPGQLYRLFTQQHFYKEDNTNDETNAPTEYGKYVDECLNEASKHFFSEGEDTYSAADLFYAGVRCGKSWLEKQGQCQVKESSISQHENKKCKENSNSLTGKDEQKPADNIEPKFKVGDWITNGEYTWKVTDIKSLDYILQSQDGNIVDDTISFVDYNYFRLWSINDAKEGDVLVDIYDNIGIFQKCKGIYWQSYLYLGCNGELLGFSDGGYHKQTKTHPATKEQRDALEKAMADAGYISYSDKKELKKIVQKHAEWSEEDERAIGIIKIALEHPYDMEGKWDRKFALDWLKSLRPQKQWKPSEEQMEALEHFIISMGESGYASPYESNTELLYSLLEQLKKL